MYTPPSVKISEVFSDGCRNLKPGGRLVDRYAEARGVIYVASSLQPYPI